MKADAPIDLRGNSSSRETHDGLQCGYCAPGRVCPAAAMLEEVAAGEFRHVTIDLVGEGVLDDDESASA